MGVDFCHTPVSCCMKAELLHYNHRRPFHHPLPPATRLPVIMALYVSEATRFLQQLKEKRPSLEAEQQRGRAIWWDKAPIDLERRAEENASRVMQKPYPYQADTTPAPGTAELL